jgi:putative ABC transport system substrate-binding protein
MRRREFITLLGGVGISWPLAAWGQQSVTPVIGFLHASSADQYASEATAFRQGLREERFFEGQNVEISYHWADFHYDRLKDLAADLVGKKVNVIFAAPVPAAMAAKEATNTLPVVFEMGADPVRIGLVASFNRPGGNITGIVNLSLTLLPKRVELIHQVAPNAGLIAVLLNPDNQNSKIAMDDVRIATQKLAAVRVEFLQAKAISDIDASFAKIIELGGGVLVVGADPFFVSQTDRIAALATRYAIPTIHESLPFAKAGGLMSYGADLSDAYRLAGIYVSRILKGQKPADLPVQQATKLQLVINLQAAKALGLTIPLALLGRADELIE